MSIVIEKSTISKIIDCLEDRQVGGLVHGRAEIGPRALGNRSIIADPRIFNIKDKINGLIKVRAAYRPLSPMCLDICFDKNFYPFKSSVNLNFMLYAVKCKKECIKNYPSIVHADGTARVQVVTKKQFPFLYKLLREFYEMSGSGILINTSLNPPYEPIADTLSDVIDAYVTLDLDFIKINDILIRRNK